MANRAKDKICIGMVKKIKKKIKKCSGYFVKVSFWLRSVGIQQ